MCLGGVPDSGVESGDGRNPREEAEKEPVEVER